MAALFNMDETLWLVIAIKVLICVGAVIAARAFQRTRLHSSSVTADTCPALEPCRCSKGSSRPLMRRARAVGFELSNNRGGVLDKALREHVILRHSSESKRPASFFAPNTDVAALVIGTLRAPDSIFGDAEDARVVFYYRDRGYAASPEVFNESAKTSSREETSVVKVVAQMSARGGPGSRPRLVTAYPYWPLPDSNSDGGGLPVRRRTRGRDVELHDD
jgi:hypothetical protein